MKALSKPLSSPSRADKFPPPLMRFLRSNVGSRSSRGRSSRASPMFYLRSAKKSVPEITQEPSSPKVTCIGQVRVRRAGKSRSKRRRGGAVKRRHCWWLRRALICGKFSARFRPFRRVLWRWGLFFRSGYCKKVDAREDSISIRVHSHRKEGENENVRSGNNTNAWRKRNNSEIDNCNQHRETKADFLESDSASPPKNALILTRCRSAPYRSSSLGGRLFWGSPLTDERDDNCTSQIETNPEESPISDREPRISCNETKNSAKTGDDSKTIAGGAVHPLLLTRSKSEPARTGVRLDPAANFTA